MRRKPRVDTARRPQLAGRHEDVGVHAACRRGSRRSSRPHLRRPFPGTALRPDLRCIAVRLFKPSAHGAATFSAQGVVDVRGICHGASPSTKNSIPRLTSEPRRACGHRPARLCPRARGWSLISRRREWRRRAPACVKPSPSPYPRPVAWNTVSASSIPSVTASASRSLTGANMIGHPTDFPTMILSCSVSALLDPSGASRVTCTPHTASSVIASTPGSGPPGIPKVAIIAGGYSRAPGGSRALPGERT